MKSIKSFDLYQKVSVQNLQEQTTTGGFVSISAILLIIFLLIKELHSFLTPSIKKEPIIFNHIQSDPFINANFSMKINCPCSIIAVDQETLIGAHVMDIKEGIQKVRMDRQGQIIKGSYVPHQTDSIQKSFKENESCYVNGFVKIRKAPGDIHFSFHPFREVWEYQKNQGFNSSLILDHKILSFTFGQKNENEEILKIFGENENTKMLLSHQVAFPEYRNHTDLRKFDYYMKLIPHIFYEERSGRKISAYQYSLSYKSQVIDSEDEMAIIMINYDMSPITMKITLQNKKLSNFIIHICAIVGGVVTFFALANKLLQTKIREE